MRSLHIIAMLVAAVGLLVTVSLMISTVMQRPGAASPGRPDPGLEGVRIPAFSLVDQDGRARTQELLEGEYTIVDFVFTNCPLACPGMTATMSEVQSALAGTGVRFASFSLDPGNDTPEMLREYAARYGADLTTWTFLTGDREAVWSMVRDSLRFDLSEDESRPIELADGTTMLNINHPVRFILVGPRRELLGMYKFDEPAQMEMLKERARALAGRSRR